MKDSAGNLARGTRLTFYESSMRKKVSRRAIAAKNNTIHAGNIITHPKDTTVLNASWLMPWKIGKLGIW